MFRLLTIILMLFMATLYGYGQESDYPRLKPRPQMSESQFDVGHFPQDQFKFQDIKSLSELDVYKLPHYKKRNAHQSRFRLVSYQSISENFYTYILFDEFYGEAGAFMLYTVDTSGYLINLIEFKGGDGDDNGGYFTNSEFINDTLLLSRNTKYIREKSESGNLLDTWQLKIKEVEYSIAKTGEIFIKSEREVIKSNQLTF
ncbi:hypothetical protein LVD15_22640 [Fulvivirga maritima]|uniref:hypothetical protein n=1 Tax=Fulvivirga maritima TaxID=2904247 RepID=UPI001F27BC2E|nr:hypothetical protein [Fulvivirga maritima]UII26072.1 hypothetical protein LVD15_22640 [Fulvivirga maritima]